MQQNIIRLAGLKCLGALAFAAALTLPAPARADNANVNVYGQVNVSYDMINTGSAVNVSGVSSSRVSSNSSHLGLKGANELGSGWSALWQVESTVGTDTGASGGVETSAGTASRSTRLFDRNTYLGLSSEDFGKVLLGRHDTPYKMSTRRLDVFADGIADNRSLMGTMIAGGVVMETFDVRQSNQILYLIPNFGSFSGALGYANLSETNTSFDQVAKSSLSLAAMYQQGPVYATVAYEVHSSTMKKTQSVAVKAVKFGWGYTMAMFDFGVAVEKSSDQLGNINPYDPVAEPCGDLPDGANCSGHSTLYLSAKIKLSADDAIKLAYSKAGQVGAAKDATGAIQFAMGVDHDINEYTTVYFLYSSLKNDKLVSYGLSNAASSGASSVNSSGTGGASPAVFSFGIRHSF